MNIFRYFIDEHALGEVFSAFPLWGLLLAIVATVFLLSRGADWMIDGAVDLATRTKLPKVVIGATILSLGTTAPEVFVSVMAAFMGNPGLALGNGVGSIIADTGLIFGLSALLAKPPVNKWILNRTGWWQMGSALLLVALAGVSYLVTRGNPVINRPMGLILVILLVVYMIMTYRWARSGNQPIGITRPEDTDVDGMYTPSSLFITLLMLFGGLALVIIASRMLIPAASETARRLGVPDDVIAATMVALGTSLPELTTAITAIRKGHPEITVGNIVGADVLNALFVVGAASLAAPLTIGPTFFMFHFPAMLIILVSFRVFISMDRDGRFRRWQGAWLLGLYIVYVALQYILVR